jgi:hypothetical protein
VKFNPCLDMMKTRNGVLAACPAPATRSVSVLAKGTGMAPARLCAALCIVLCACAAPPVQPSAPSPTSSSRALADERAIDLRPHPWTHYDVMEDNRIRVHYTVTGSLQCNALGRVEIAESADTVTLTLHIGRLPAAGCAAKVLKATELFTDVELPAPLGGRSVRDGSV